jgi:exosome complex component RRP4
VTNERKRLGEHVYLQNGAVYSDALGVCRIEPNEVSVVPLRGRYVPQVNDIIVGIVQMEIYSGYLIDVNAVGPAFVSKKELRDPLQVGAIVSAKVMSLNETRDIEIGFVRVFYGGTVLSLSASKVPRMIGKNGSMLEVLKNGTGCNLMIGRNGYAWVKGGDMNLLQVALARIDDESHHANLTNRMTEFLRQKPINSALKGVEQ